MKKFVYPIVITTSLSLFLASCGGDPTSSGTSVSTTEPEPQELVQAETMTDTSEMVQDEVMEQEMVEEVVETVQEAMPKTSSKDWEENEKYRIAELERRRKLAMEANPGMEIPKPQPKDISDAKFQSVVSTPSMPKSTTTASTTKATTSTPKPEPKTTVAAAVTSAPVAKKTAPVKPTGKAEITFDMKKFSFDTIVEGDVINHKFKFVNTGKRPIEILNAKASCGCTRPSFPFLEIEPGGEGFIGVTYDSRTKEGDQTPEIEVITNFQDEPIMLYLDGHVKDKPKPVESIGDDGEEN